MKRSRGLGDVYKRQGLWCDDIVFRGREVLGVTTESSEIVRVRWVREALAVMSPKRS